MVDDMETSHSTILDLPQLHNKPSAATLLSTLSQLAITPSDFNGKQAKNLLDVSEDGLTGYLTRYISSSLAWIASDIEKEEIWEAASQRLSERSGRMAMASISRTFTICDFAVNRDGKAPRYIDIQLKEPSLTGINLGHKTWVGSFLLAKRLPHTMAKHFPSLLPPPTPRNSPRNSDEFSNSIAPMGRKGSQLPPPPISPTTQSMSSSKASIKVLELGAGTGLTGIAAAALFSNIAVHLTDLPSILPNLLANVESNSHLFECRPSVAVLDWSQLPTLPYEQYDCVIAADSLYDPQHPDWLTNTMTLFLKREKESRVVVELPFREMDHPYHDMLREEMVKKGFVLLEDGEESGWDDWDLSWSEKVAVNCWWSVWGWANGELHKPSDGARMEKTSDKGQEEEYVERGLGQGEQKGTADSMEHDRKDSDASAERDTKACQQKEALQTETATPTSHEHPGTAGILQSNASDDKTPEICLPIRPYPCRNVP